MLLRDGFFIHEIRGWNFDWKQAGDQDHNRFP